MPGDGALEGSKHVALMETQYRIVVFQRQYK